MPAGFYQLIAAQFVSAVADNALLIVALAWLQTFGYPVWWAPLLKLFFTIAYVVLAPWVGALADTWPKARVMAVMNVVKMAGLLLLLAGANPLLAFCVAGTGAAVYAPAKYGLLTELVRADRLVRANAWLEVSVVGAAISGVALGGVLISETARGWLMDQVGGPGDGLTALFPDSSPEVLAVKLALLCVLAIYLLASVLNWGLPDSGARYASASWRPAALLVSFWQANRTLWRDRDGGMSLSVTTVFWGVGATLQIAVIQWADLVLDLSLDKASYLQAVVAMGVVVGAAAAGRWVSLSHAARMLWAGVALGLLIALASTARSIEVAAVYFVGCGAVGGLLVVPLNALLQHRGHALLSAGRSIAVQNFNENLSVLCMLGAYSLLLAQGADVRFVLAFLGASIALLMVMLIVRSAGDSRVPKRVV